MAALKLALGRGGEATEGTNVSLGPGFSPSLAQTNIPGFPLGLSLFSVLPPTGSRNTRELELLPALCQAPWVDLKTQRNKMQSVPALGGAQR